MLPGFWIILFFLAEFANLWQEAQDAKKVKQEEEEREKIQEVLAKGDTKDIMESFISRAKKIQSETQMVPAPQPTPRTSADQDNGDDEVIDISRGTWSK